MITFGELAIGDWFIRKGYPKEVYIKKEISVAILISNVSSPTDLYNVFDSDVQVDFIPSFHWDRSRTDVADDFSDENISFGEEINNFAEIKIGDIYKGTGVTIYKKFNETDVIAILSYGDIGAVYSRRPRGKGTFYICNNMTFNYPEGKEAKV